MPLRAASLGLMLQIVGREQELMSMAGLQSLGGSAGLGRGGLDRELRIVPSKLAFPEGCHKRHASHALLSTSRGSHSLQAMSYLRTLAFVMPYQCILLLSVHSCCFVHAVQLTCYSNSLI